MAAASPFSSGNRRVLHEKVVDSLTNGPPALTPRILHAPALLPGKATAVVGMRRAGKTYFLHQQRAERMASGVPLAMLPYVNFEDERLEGISPHDLTALVEDYYARFPKARGRQTVTWCFDEIQLVPGWDSFVRRLLDSERVEVFVSGSSARLLSREVATALRGRAWQVTIHPFSFAESLHHAGKKIDQSPWTPRARSSLERALLEYLVRGGFPEVQSLEDTVRKRVLADYVDVAILRDVIERHEVSAVTALRWLVRHFIGNAAARFSAQKFHDALRSQGIAVSKDTVHALVSHLEDCYLIRTSWAESRSERQRMSNPRKSYPVDPGLIPLYDRSGRANHGHALETAVRIELERRGCDITYVRTPGDGEVDFLARFPDRAVQLIQVCMDASDPAVAEREFRALLDASRDHPSARAVLIVGVTAGMPRKVPAGVACTTAASWLLDHRDA